MRALFIAIQALMTIIGLALTGYASPPGWRYTGESDDKSMRVVRLLISRYRNISGQRRLFGKYSRDSSIRMCLVFLTSRCSFPLPVFKQHHLTL